MSSPMSFPMGSPQFFSPQKNGTCQCDLCPHRCVLKPGETGRCLVRFNRGGSPSLPFRGFVSGLAVDPIEKKPLYHFRPGTQILSAGFVGCNLSCPFCQNWHISQNTESSGRVFSPAELITQAMQSMAAMQSIAASQSVAYTYSEPLVHFEFLLDCMKEGRKAGVANVLVSNGCINTEAAAEILEHCDAANIDLKCFSAETYKKILGGCLSTVTGFIQMAVEKGVHLEITTLVVPELNDSEAELDKCRDFIAELQTGGSAASGIVVPWHLSAYRPCYKWKTPPTNPSSLIAATERAREKLDFVYTGNISHGIHAADTDTHCPGCKKCLISRRGYRADTSGLSPKKDNGKLVYHCVSCGKKAPVRW